MTASGFRVARVPPLMGRPLVEDDEREGAPPVVVIGYDEWRTRFAQDRSVIGQEVRIGDTVHTVVGVMPERFGFPLNHQYWTPLRANPSAFARGEGPILFVFGRLAPGVTMNAAQTELTTIGRRTAASFAKTHSQLRPQVLPYTFPLVDTQDITVGSVATMQLIISLVLVVVALNVAILVYARTAMRRGEIAVRTALLGASRSRIVLQLFVEALALALGPALLGLGLAQVGFRLGNLIMEQEVGGAPFWADYSLRPATALYTVGLVILAAAIVGVLPALQATGRRIQSDVRQLGGGTGMRLGRMWTVLIVAQVAIAVAVLPAAVKLGLSEIRGALTRPTFPAEEFLVAAVTMERPPPAAVWPGGTPVPPDSGGQPELNSRFGDRLMELKRRLQTEADVAGVTSVAYLPGRRGRVRLEVDAVPAPAGSPSGHQAVTMGVDRSYFDVYGARLLAGRRFEGQDEGDAGSAVIVNRSFVRKVLGGGNAVGHRIRYMVEPKDGQTSEAQPGRCYEIVGVAENLQGNPIDPDQIQAMVYYPVAPAQVSAAALVLRMRGPASTAFGGRLQEITVTVDPALRLGTVRTGAGENRQAQAAIRLVALLLGLIMLTVLVLSAAGVYALMAFTVAQRRREIGIRRALGAPRRQVLVSIFSRVVAQIGLGVVVGVAGAVALLSSTGGLLLAGPMAMLIPAVALIMAVVGVLSAFGPARQAVGIQPGEALRAE